jgi:dihydroorotate dehydrogenase
MGITFKNPVGLAAGFDKNGECLEGMASFGIWFS